jgi:hypothetical protein
VEHVESAAVIQDSGFHADKRAISPPVFYRRHGLARIVEVSTFHTKYPKEQL